MPVYTTPGTPLSPTCGDRSAPRVHRLLVAQGGSPGLSLGDSHGWEPPV